MFRQNRVVIDGYSISFVSLDNTLHHIDLICDNYCE